MTTSYNVPLQPPQRSALTNQMSGPSGDAVSNSSAWRRAYPRRTMFDKLVRSSIVWGRRLTIF